MQGLLFSRKKIKNTLTIILMQGLVFIKKLKNTLTIVLMQGLLFSRKKNKKYANYCPYAQYRILKILLLIFPRVQKFQVATHQLSPVFYSLLYSLNVTNYRSTHITFQVAPNNNEI